MVEEQQDDMLQTLLFQIENCEKAPEVVEWMNDICEPNAEAPDDCLISTMILAFMECTKNATMENQILRCLRKLNEFVPKSVLPQMKANINFPKAIVKYIVQTEPKKLEGDCFVLLAEIFLTSSFKEVTNDDFIRVLFNALDFIAEEQVFTSIVFILISMSAEFKNPQFNPVIKICLAHQNQRYFQEYLVHLINKGNEGQISKSLRFVSDIYILNKHDFFRTNDLQVLIDVLVRDISSTANDDMRIIYLKVLKTIVSTKEGQKENQNRKNIILDLLADLKYSKVGETSRELAQQIFDILIASTKN